MGELTCTPWRRWGHDRVYVARAGAKLGYLDRTTGAIHVAAADLSPARAALVQAGYLDPPVDWALTLPGDTATNVAGASARAMARTAADPAPWQAGAEGEEQVARRLKRLGREGWRFAHDVTIGTRGANVDHVVVGPGGVFALNAKNHKGSVWVAGDNVRVDGYPVPYVRASRREAARVADRLAAATGEPVAVRAVIVVVGDRLTVKEQPHDVAVVTRRALRRWLRAQPAVLDAAAVDDLHRAIRDPRTWVSRVATR